MKVCTKCGIEKSLSDYYEVKKGSNTYRSKCKKCCNTQSKDHHKKQYRDNVEHYRNIRKQYRTDNREKLNEYARKQYNTFSIHKEIKIFRCYLTDAIREYKENTVEWNVKQLGCSISFLCSYLNIIAHDKGFSDFDILNYTKDVYNIDHIIPFKKVIDGLATMEEVCHYTNMTILPRIENESKGGKY